MDEKVKFIADHLRGGISHSGLCRRYSISRKTGYKWVHRYEAEALKGLNEQSRRPYSSPQRTPYVVRQAIVELRQSRRSPLGAKKIQALLRERFPDQPPPSKTTIYHILQAAGLTQPQRRRHRISPYAEPFAPVTGPNGVWSVDFKGQFQLTDGRWCYPLTLMDHYSRYLLGCHGVTGTDTRQAKRLFMRWFQTYGLPERIRSDNGVPFASRAAGGLSRLSIWWIRLGILPERIEPGKPQQNGRHERMHRTLKQATVQPPASGFQAQQRRFDAFRVDYNEERPHEALDQRPPASCYQRSPRVYPARLPEPEYPGYFVTHRVSSTGVIYAHNGQVYLSHLLAGERVGLEQIDDGVWDAYFGPIRLGTYNQRQPRSGKTPYWTIRV